MCSGFIFVTQQEIGRKSSLHTLIKSLYALPSSVSHCCVCSVMVARWLLHLQSHSCILVKRQRDQEVPGKVLSSHEKKIVFQGFLPMSLWPERSPMRILTYKRQRAWGFTFPDSVVEDSTERESDGYGFWMNHSRLRPDSQIIKGKMCIWGSKSLAKLSSNYDGPRSCR